MADETTSTKAISVSGLEQMNVKVPPGTLQLAHQLGAVCNVPVAGIVRAAIDLFAMAHEVEQRGGKITLVGPTGETEAELRLPHRGIKTVPIKQIEYAIKTEEPK